MLKVNEDFEVPEPGPKKGEQVELCGELDEHGKPIYFTSGTDCVPVTLEPPYYYLGDGSEKFVVSAIAKGLERLTKHDGSIRVAMGISRYPGHKLSGLDSYRRVKRAPLPTYPWYMESEEADRCLMPDLTDEGAVVTGNDLSLSVEDQKLLVEGLPKIIEQGRTIIETTLHFDPVLRFTYDSLFCVLRQGGDPKVLLGDFDETSVRPWALKKEYEDKVPKERFLEMLRDDMTMGLQLFIDNIRSNLTARL